MATPKLELLRLLLEAAVAGQMALFAAFVFAGEGRRSQAGVLLGAFSGGLGAIVAINLASSGGGLSWLRDLNLLIELSLPPLAFLYLRQVRLGARPLGRWQALHATAPVVIFVAYRTGLVRDMDPVVVAWFFAHALAMAWILARQGDAFRPAPLRRFAMVLTATLAAFGALRLLLALDVRGGVAWRQDGAYLAVLATAAVLSCSILYLGLRWPRLLFAPSSLIKYAASDMTPAELDALQSAFDRLMSEEQPFLDAQLSVADIARRLGVTERRLSQMVNSRHGVNLPARLNALRIEAAARLLDAPSAPQVTTVMYDVGFGSKSAFQREFRRRFGLTAGEYRARAAARRQAAVQPPSIEKDAPLAEAPASETR